MRIGIISSDETLYSTRRLYDAAKERGHDVSVVDYLLCYMNITSNKPSINYKGKSIDSFDAIIPRVSPERTFYGASIVRALFQFDLTDL